MAPTRRRHPLDLRARLGREPYRFGFFQALRLLCLMQPAAERAQGGLPSKLRFRTVGTLAFPPSEVARYQTMEATGQPVDELEVAFMGLTGPSGVLPSPYTEMVQDRRAHHHDEGLHRFLDLFSHRAIALLAEAWRKSRFWHAHELTGESSFTQHVMDLAGGQNPERQPLPGHTLAYFAGTLARRVPSASGLALALSGWIGRPVVLEQFVGQWVHLSEADQSCLGRTGMTLGQDAFVGSRVWDRQSKLRLRIGPLAADKISTFLPGGEIAQSLTRFLRHSLGLSLACDLALLVEAEGIHPPRLEPNGPRLGLDTWLTTQPLSGHREDVTYPLLA